MNAPRLVVIGNGMAGVACVEQILKHNAAFDITIFGDETHVNYNRILLSSVLAGGKGFDDPFLFHISPPPRPLFTPDALFCF